MPTQLNPGQHIVPITRPIIMVAGDFTGHAIAMAYSGNSMQYLLVPAAADDAPTWFDQSEVTKSYLKPGT